MASVDFGKIVFGVFYCISTVILIVLLVRSFQDYYKKKRKMQHASKSHAAMGISLFAMCAFTLSLLLHSLHFIMFYALGGKKVDFLDFLNNICYAVGIWTALWVWIRRLQDTFQKSAHGYSKKYMRNLRLFYKVTMAWAAITAVEHAIVIALDATRMVTVFLGGIMTIMFVSLFIIVLVSFIRKMKQSVKLAEQVAQNTAHQTHAIGAKLVQLVVKFTILAVLCIGSTLFALVCALSLMGIGLGKTHWTQVPLAIDNIMGFFSLFCAWSVNKVMYRTIFGCVHSAIIKYQEDFKDEPSADAPSINTTRAMAVGLGSVGSSSKLSGDDESIPQSHTTMTLAPNSSSDDDTQTKAKMQIV
eukprot:278178_1